jgi:hypothetical protein
MADVVTIGRTHYYTVRKGPQQYRVAEGKRLNDPECCWLVLKDQESGKAYYVNHSGVRRWHLPDIYQSEAEKAAEEAELKFRRERKQSESVKDNKSEAPDQQQQAAPGEEQEAVIDYAVRDAEAVKLKPNREWEDVEKRRQVFKHVKASLAPLAAKGDIDDELFPTVVATICHEFFASNTRFGAAEKKKLTDEALAYAQLRIEEKQIKEAYRKMNQELLDKIKRIDGERKAANAKVLLLQQGEEAMKTEIFHLRGHKQDTLLSSFKRLTRAGLIKTYWSRWKVFKDIVEAQLHVRARERRALEMAQTNTELGDEVAQLKTFVKQLQDRVQKAEGRDVIAMLLKQSGLQLVHRYFTQWRRFSIESLKEKQFFEAREQIMNCPNCELREVDAQRVRARLHEAWAAYRDAMAQLTGRDAEVQRLEMMVQEKCEYAALHARMAAEANARAQDMSERCTKADGQLWSAAIKQQQLEGEIERLQFEVMSLSDFGGNSASAGAAGAGTGVRGNANDAGNSSRTIGDFFTNESEAGALKLRGRLASRTQGLSKAAKAAEGLNASVVMTSAKLREDQDFERRSPRRGAVRLRTEAALAPLIRAMPPPESPFDPRYYDPTRPRPPSEEAPESLMYRRPMTTTDDRSSAGSGSPPPGGSSSSDDEAPPPPAPEDDKCDRCGFRKRLTPFCPKDGSRHLFDCFEDKVDPLRRLQPDQSEAAYTLAARRTLREQELSALPPGLPPPEFRKPAAAQAGPALPYSSIGTAIRASLNLDPRTYDPRTAVPLHHTEVGPLEGDTRDLRAVADHVRNTRMAIERRTQLMQERHEPVALPPGHVPLTEFRKGTAQGLTELHSGIGIRTVAQPSDRHTTKPSWNRIFDYNDADSETFGIGGVPNPAFGVYRATDPALADSAVVPAQRVRTEQRATPSMAAWRSQ